MSAAQARLLPERPLALRPDLCSPWAGTVPRELARGEYLYLPGDPARSVFLLRTGAMRLGRLLDSGRELTLDVAGPGELVGEGAALGEAHRPGLAQALERVRVAPLPVSALEAALSRSPDLALALARITAERSRRLEARALAGAFADCRRRLAGALLDLAERFGAEEEGGRRIGVRLTHEELARIIGAARETVTPLLVDLRRAGLLDYDRRRILVRELPALRKIAAGA